MGNCFSGRLGGSLHFTHGTMAAGKTAQMVMAVYKARADKKDVIAMKPHVDVRYGDDGVIRSRVPGLAVKADAVIRSAEDVFAIDWAKYTQGFCDEVHFLSESVIDAFRKVVDLHGVTITCYGLTTTFQCNLFKPSARLLKVADGSNEIESDCSKCNRKAVYNLRHRNGHAIYEGAEIELGDEDRYSAVCAKHYLSFQHTELRR
jgi:thymidine kinase